MIRSKLQVEEYMSQLPNHVIPRANSIGEKNRERQLMVQLPRQDLSIAYCTLSLFTRLNFLTHASIQVST